MMSQLLHQLPLRTAERTPDAIALRHKGTSLSYAALAQAIGAFADAMLRLGLARHDRVAVFLPKQPETVITMFGAAAAGCIFVPVNPILKPAQVGHILRDCNVRVLVTSPERLPGLPEMLAAVPGPARSWSGGATSRARPLSRLHVGGAHDGAGRTAPHRVIDTDMVSIFYTSGSTGKPKGVVLSHRNMVTGAHSVAQYLGNTPEDRLLAVLPFSFDYGFSQLSTAFHVGASVVLMDYLFPQDVIAMAGARARSRALAGVPPLWAQLADLEWPAGSHASTCATSPTPAARCRSRRWRSCAQRCRARRSFSCTG